MFILQKLNQKLTRLIGLSILILLLSVSPVVLKNHALESSNAPTIAIAQETDTSQKGQDNSSQPQEKSTKDSNKEQSSQDKKEELDPIKMTMGFLGGLVLFLYGVTRLADGLREVAGDRVKKIVRRFTETRFAGILTGAVATTILDSSSVTIIMVIAMVDAGLLSFAHSLSVVLGSNIGTTIGAQIVAFNIDQFGPIAMVIGAGLQFFGKTDRQKQIGIIIFGIGLLLFGLGIIGDAMEPFKGYPPFLDLMKRLADHPIQGAAIGALFTVLVQSSSATVAIIVTLASQGLISLPAGIALMLGAEVGTCADTLVASLGRDRGALRTGLFHLIFNVTSATIALGFANQLAAIAETVSLGAGVGRQIANAQLIFNLVGVFAVIWFIPLIARMLQALIPDGKSDSAVQPAD